MKVIEYTLLTAALGEIEEAVNQHIQWGWQPLGSPFMTHEARNASGITRDDRFCQAMVKHAQTSL